MAREIGRAAQLPWLQRCGAGESRLPIAGTIAFGLAAMLSRTGFALSAAASAAALPIVASEFSAASQGYALMQQTGLGRAASLRAFATLPHTVALAAAPLLGHCAKLCGKGYPERKNEGFSQCDVKAVMPTVVRSHGS